MTQKVYVVFHDHRDYNTDGWELDYDYKRRFWKVFGKDVDARGYLEHLVLDQYYHEYCDAIKIEEIYADLYDRWDYYSERNFDVIKNEFNKIVVQCNGDEDTYYFEEYGITT